MTVFDTDLLTEILLGNAAYAERLAAIPLDEQAVSIVTVEEIIRGRLNSIRQAQSGKSHLALDHAYSLFEQSLKDIQELRIVAYTSSADAIVQDWRKRKVKGSSNDLRIAASCVAISATLVTRNRRDFEHIPGLRVEFWG